MDARGSASGVIGPNKLSSYPWTHWAIPPQLVDVDPTSTPEPKEPEVIKVAYQAKVVATSGKTVNMRKSASTSASIITVVGVGQTVDVMAVTGDWSQITWNGKTGYMQSKFLEKINGSEENKIWYVRLECDSEAQAKALAQILAKAKATT